MSHNKNDQCASSTKKIKIKIKIFISPYGSLSNNPIIEQSGSIKTFSRLRTDSSSYNKGRENKKREQEGTTYQFIS